MTTTQTCRHCGEEIEPSNSDGWEHVDLVYGENDWTRCADGQTVATPNDAGEIQ